MAIDVSYRDTGVCVITEDEYGIVVDRTISIKNEELGTGFYSWLNASGKLRHNTLKSLDLLICEYKPNVIIAEMPCFTQNAKSAVAIGMCWGVMSCLSIEDAYLIFVEPSALKKWSGSKRGDKKEKVKEKVLSRMVVSITDAANNNIIDAIGLALMFRDAVRREYHDTNNTNQ